MLSRSKISIDALLSTRGVNKSVYKQVRNVYFLLSATVLACVAGTQVPSSVPLHLSSFVLFALTAVAALSVFSLTVRAAALFAVGFVSGMSLRTLLAVVAEIDPNLVTIAAVGTALIFVCFSFSALVSERRSHLYLGGVLGSALTGLVLLGIANRFLLHSTGIAWFHIYCGLLVFSGFVLFDTQLMIERIANGSNDIVGNALNLFLDALNIFVRLLAILAKNSGKNKSKQNNKRR